MENQNNKTVSQLIDDILKISDKPELSFLVSQLLIRFVFSLDTAEKSLIDIKEKSKPYKKVRTSDSISDHVLSDIYYNSQECISSLHRELFGE